MTSILGYPRKSESDASKTLKAVKAKRGKPDGFVGTDSDGYATLTELGSGTPSSGVYLRGDGTWASLFPVGATYITTVNTNPATLLGFGAWGSLGSGTVLIGGIATTKTVYWWERTS